MYFTNVSLSLSIYNVQILHGMNLKGIPFEVSVCIYKKKIRVLINI